MYKYDFKIIKAAFNVCICGLITNNTSLNYTIIILSKTLTSKCDV